MGVIVACVPAFSPLLRSFSRKVSSNSRSRSGGAKSGGGATTAYGQSVKSAVAATGARTPARKSRVLDSIRDDDEVELCEAKNGWEGCHGWGSANGGTASTQVRTVGVADDGDSDQRSGASSPCGGPQQQQQQQHITVVHEYTVQHADAKGGL